MVQFQYFQTFGHQFIAKVDKNKTALQCQITKSPITKSIIRTKWNEKASNIWKYYMLTKRYHTISITLNLWILPVNFDEISACS